MSAAILAIDLGKFNSVLCAFDPGTREASFRTVKTTPAVLRAELLRQPVVSVVIEACSPAGWVHDLCEELNLPCLVADTSEAAWRCIVDPGNRTAGRTPLWGVWIAVIQGACE